MNYIDYFNNFINFSRFLLALIILYIFFPKLILKTKNTTTLLESFFTYFIKMTFFYIVIGYILVFTKLYELLSILTIISILASKKQLFNSNINKFEELKDNFYIYFFRILDDFTHPIKSLKGWIIKNNSKIFDIFRPYFVLNKIPFIFVFSFSAYIRFYDSIMHSAPGLSDSYVTLEWMKNIDRREIFKTGIYPQGFHIILATISKIASTDSIYMIKFMGPFNGLLTVLGIYFFISRVLNSKPAALVSSFFYGVLGWSILGGDWARQASTNSQEFAFVFVFPTLYFFYKYLKEKTRPNLILFFAGTAIIGFVHTFAFFYFVIAVFSISFGFLIVNFKDSFIYILKSAALGIAASILSILPIGIGLLLGHKFHSSSVDYLNSSASNFTLTKLALIDYLSIVSIVVILLYTFFIYKNTNESPIPAFSIFTITLSLISFLLYFAGGVITKSVLISSRSGILWALTVPIMLGFSWYILTIQIPDSKKTCSFKCLLTSLLILSTLLFLSLNPRFSGNLRAIAPYKMEWDSSINQYLRIKSDFPLKEWLYVSNIEGYSVVLGSGFHLMQEDFLKIYNPKNKYIYSINTTDKIPFIFLYLEKNIFKVDKKNSVYFIMEPKYKQREKNYKELALWINEYRKSHNNLKKYYEDKNIKIYYIKQEKTKKEIKKDIWDKLDLAPKEADVK
jgi:hypothetical protein